MQQNYQTTQIAGLGQDVGSGSPDAVWSNPNNITVDDSNDATIAFTSGGQGGDALKASQFGFSLPDGAVIDGIAVNIDGESFGGVAVDLSLNIAGSTPKSNVGSLDTLYGGIADLWGLDNISIADVESIDTSLILQDQSGGDGSAEINFISITVYWHIDLVTAPADVKPRVVYKVFSRDGEYLGNLPNVTSRFGFSQDINTAGSSIKVVCGKYAQNETTVDELITEDGDDITTEDGLDLLATKVDTVVAVGSSDEMALFKNSNRVRVFLYNYWHPNGKLMFSGQINRVDLKMGGGDANVQLTLLSDGLDLDNYIARGYPFSYTTDISQTVSNTDTTISQGGGKQSASYIRCGQSWIAGGSANNIGAIKLRLVGTADVTVSVYDNPNGNLLGSVTRRVAVGTYTNISFEFSQLIDITPGEEYFFAVSVAPGQKMRVKYNTTNVYSDGVRFTALYAGTSGGGYTATTGDLYFEIKYGVPTTTTTYSSQDPITGMASGIILDYNTRGGFITPRNLVASGLSLTYMFNMATIFDAIKKVIELSPAGYYSYIDLGTAEIDILPMTSGPDFTVVNGKNVSELELSLSIEQVKNYFLFSGGESSPGVNLYRQYQDTESSAMYGLRTATKSDNRVTVDATANALGSTYIEESSNETQETTVTVLDAEMDITQLTPGKTIGFRGYGSFIDDMVLQIVRREYSVGAVNLSLGRLPVTMNAEIQRLTRELMLEQTVNNPTQPS